MNPVPWPSKITPSIVIDGHEIKVAMETHLPKGLLFQNFLTDAECDELIQLAQNGFTRSTAINRDTGVAETFDSRTSDGTYFAKAEYPLVERIERRIEKLLNWPGNRTEGLQMLRYPVGTEYKPHNDYFDPQLTGSKTIIDNGGQRCGTLLMYLETPEEGGDTFFPASNIRVHAQKGNAFLFTYYEPTIRTLTLHAGSPVIKGMKYVSTAWFKQMNQPVAPPGIKPGDLQVQQP